MKSDLSGSSSFNVIFDSSDNINGERILNICLQKPHERAYYWLTINTHAIRMSAEAHLSLLKPHLASLTDNNFLKINSFSTDTCATMRSLRQLVLQDPNLQHCFWTFCDSHSLQLLIKDILDLPFYKTILDLAITLISGFYRSPLQKARLREEGEKLDKKFRTLIKP